MCFIAEAGKRAQISEPVTPHILRVDIETRAKMLGHSIETAIEVWRARGERD